MSDRRTKQQILTELEVMRTERDQWRTVAPSDKEAKAIAECVRALANLTETSGYSAGRGNVDRDAVKRVLNYLADRCGVTR